MLNKTEHHLIEVAFQHLQKELGDAVQQRTLLGKDSLRYDAIFELNRTPLYIEAKIEIGPKQIENLSLLKNQVGNLMVVANYITPKAKEMLRAKGVHYMDADGNISLRMDKIIIFIDGIPNRPPTPQARTRLFAKAGLQVVFWLLQDPNNVNISYRDLADRANVALGNLPILFKALLEERFLVKIDAKKWSLVDRKRLLDLWVQEFGRRLKPAQFVGLFQASQPDFRQHWKEMHLQNGGIWGGEPGADLLTSYLVPGTFTLYTNAKKLEIIQNYRWAPNPNGNIAIYSKFWKDDPILDEKAKPLLAYADLIENGDERGLEAAKMIHDQYLNHL